MWDNPTLLKNTSRALFALSVLMLLYSAAYYALHLPNLLPIRAVKLAAAPVQVDAEQVLQVVREQVRGNFFTVDIEQLRVELEKLTWVRQVSIRREFPNRLSVELAEHQALAHWNNQALVNSYGEVFNASTAATLPDFVGQAGHSAQLAEQYALCNTQLAKVNLRVQQIAQSPRFAWQLRLDNGMVLELGSEDMEARLARFVQVYPYSLATQHSAVKTVDLRYRNGFAVSGVHEQSLSKGA
ncbi:MAG: cell division protein FtsQ/DivIB [Sideroxydans sp.]|nr:cell division protein FtsQ/DivIB [Sideroxydans sp.]